MKTADFLTKAPQNNIIQKTIMTMAQKLDFDGTCLVSISGGSDSDILMDLIENSEKTCKIVYVFFDTGIEYQATHDHLKYLENKYGVMIERLKPKCPIPLAIKQYGVPIFSKQESEYLGRLQRHNFDFASNKNFEIDYAKHPKAKSALCYWHNNWGESSSFNIERRKGLKEFIQHNPPDFNISNKCCQKAKKDVAHMAETIFKPDLKIVGVRKDEGGQELMLIRTASRLQTRTVSQNIALCSFGRISIKLNMIWHSTFSIPDAIQNMVSNEQVVLGALSLRILKKSFKSLKSMNQNFTRLYVRSLVKAMTTSEPIAPSGKHWGDRYRSAAF